MLSITVACFAAFGTRAVGPNVENVPVERGGNGTVGAQRTQLQRPVAWCHEIPSVAGPEVGFRQQTNRTTKSRRPDAVHIRHR